MLFNSFEFIGLLIITFLVYYLPYCRKYQVPILIVSSLLFYTYHQPTLVFLLLLSVTINIVSSYYVVYGNLGYKRFAAVTGVVLNLSILLVFKYGSLFARTFLDPASLTADFLINIPLPIGISFFTFQGISLVVDVYKEKSVRNRLIVSRSFCKHATRVLFFKGFFPQLISGPIVKAHDFIPQIQTKKFGEIQWDESFRNLLTGYFLKMVVADNLKDFTFWLSYPHFQGKSSITLVLMLFGYSCQIFADFAGYSLIAIGLASLFGYRFPRNFNFPYISSSLKEFWKRWHMSLSSFLMEYLYIPLGGNKKGKMRTYLNLMLVMIVGGLWHGAAWSYAIWGGVHGLALALERYAGTFRTGVGGRLIRIVQTVLVFVFVTFAWLLFKLPTFGHVLEYFKAVFDNVRMEDDANLITYIALYSTPVIVYHAAYLLKDYRLFYRIKQTEYAYYSLMLFLIITNSGSSGSFIYFQF